MPNFKAPIKTKWLKVTTTPQTLIALSDAVQWNAHFLPGKPRSFRCSGSPCPLCIQGSIPTERYVLLVENSAGRAYFLELRERHRATLMDWARKNTRDTVAGAVFTVKKRWHHRNAPVDVELQYIAERKEIPIAHFVNSLGADPRQQTLSEGSER